jgi:hypothetical protein
MIKRVLFILIIVGLLTGCPGQWVKVKDTDRNLDTQYYSLELPSNWVKIQYQGDWIISRDGPSIQKIVISGADHDDAFPSAELKSSTQMLPSELAERYIADLKKEDQDGLPSFQLEKNQPISVGDKQGFYIQAKYRTESGINYRIQAAGFVSDKGFVSISYTAPVLHYYERYSNQFDQIVASLKVKSI